MTTIITIIREIEIDVEVQYTPSVAATYWQPPEHAHVEILEAYDELNQSVNLTQSEVDQVRQMVLDSPPERDCDCD
jgi:hypothetical protein